MPLPKECRMPEISDLKTSAIALYIVTQLVGAGKNMEPHIEKYRKNFVRLVDKAVYEYNEARGAIIAQIEDKQATIYIPAIINHLENCINAIRRSLKLLDRIRNHPRAPFIMDKNTYKLINSYSKDVTSIRDTIEHIDERIAKDEIKKNCPVALDISEDASKGIIGDKSISLIRLANLIRKLHGLALEIAQYNAPGVENDKFKIIKRK